MEPSRRNRHNNKYRIRRLMNQQIQNTANSTPDAQQTQKESMNSTPDAPKMQKVTYSTTGAPKSTNKS
jgi:hypothetical protein